LFEWVFIVYPDVTCFGDLGDLGDLGGQQTVEMLACTYRGTKMKVEFTKQLREELFVTTPLLLLSFLSPHVPIW